MKRIFIKNGFEVWKIRFCKYLIINKIDMIYKYATSKKEVRQILINLGVIDENWK